MKIRRETVKYRYFIATVLVLVAALAAAGCGAAPTSVATPSQASPTQPSPTETRAAQPALPTLTSPPSPARPSVAAPAIGSPAKEVTPPPQARSVVRLAEEDLAQRLGLKPEQIRLVSVQAVEWPDTSLGCPQPGMMYAQVITPGYRVALEAGGQTYDYHTNQSDRVVLCQKGAEGGGAITPPEAENVVQLTRQDLSERAGVAPEAIRLLSVEAVEWPDAGLGCPQPGMMYAQVVTPGFRVVLATEDAMYEYHSGTANSILLCENGNLSTAAPSKELDASVQDGWPNQTRDKDIIIVPPAERK
jgi:hypothetical protein